jgi:hypothetical protein
MTRIEAAERPLAREGCTSVGSVRGCFPAAGLTASELDRAAARLIAEPPP